MKTAPIHSEHGSTNSFSNGAMSEEILTATSLPLPYAPHFHSLNQAPNQPQMMVMAMITITTSMTAIITSTKSRGIMQILTVFANVAWRRLCRRERLELRLLSI